MSTAVEPQPRGTELLWEAGPQHPSVQGPLRLRLRLDGDAVTAVDPLVGYMHRGAEKLCEVRDYRQVMALANRHEWLSAFSGELGVALLVEEATGIAPPPRATWIRTFLVELGRVLAHLAFLGAVPDALGHATALERAFVAREPLQGLVEGLTGARVHTAYACVGGVKQDLPPGWLEDVPGVLDGADQALDGLGRVLAERMVRARLRGLGVVTPVMVDGYGLTGPVARAAGVDRDLRRDAPDLAYAQVFRPEHVVTRGDGDALARLEVLLDQARVSLDLCRACLPALRDEPGEVNVRLPKVLRVPEGEYHQESENPLGVGGYYLVSRGEKAPWRLAMRTPSFATLSALPVIAPGTDLEDLPALLASLLYVTGDADR